MPSNAPVMRKAGLITSAGWPRLRPGATRAQTPGMAALDEQTSSRKAKAALDNRPSRALSAVNCRATTMAYQKGSTRPGAGAPHPTAGSAASPCEPRGERSNGRNREIDETLHQSTAYDTEFEGIGPPRCHRQGSPYRRLQRPPRGDLTGMTVV